MTRSFVVVILSLAMLFSACSRADDGPTDTEVWSNMTEQWPVFAEALSVIPGPDGTGLDPSEFVDDYCYDGPFSSGIQGVGFSGFDRLIMPLKEARTVAASVRDTWQELGHDVQRNGAETALAFDGAARISIHITPVARSTETQSSIADEGLEVLVTSICLKGATQWALLGSNTG